MSWLVFNRTLRRIYLMAGKPSDHEVHKAIGSWPAHNETASKSNGSWPPGKYWYAYYNPHEEEGLMPGCSRGSYGCFGIHVFSVFGRTGMGIHTGRTIGEGNALGGKTMGCIRVTTEAMKQINTVHSEDRLTVIIVR